MGFKHAVQLWVLWKQYGDGIEDATKLAALLGMVDERRVSLRPGRVEPLPVKLGPRAFPLLKQPGR
ncbi:MAG: hypothetical protein U9Q81_22575 [Pseudomonadota bacterium]|nr:hypothetical protein [Pseudomonadota bacterium]